MEKSHARMELFGRKEIKKTQEKSDEIVLKEGLEEEIEDLQRDFRILQEEVNENEKKLQAVKEEYDSTVTSLMEIKKETNQKKLELDVVKREYRDVKQKIGTTSEKEQKNDELISKIEKNENKLKKSKQEIEKLVDQEKEIKQKISKGESTLYEIKSQEVQSQKKIEENLFILKNTKTEKENLDNTLIFPDKEKDFIKEQIGSNQYTKGVVEAAGVVTASLKSKLSIAQKELEAVQKLLEKERKEHEITKERLEKFQSKETKKKL